MVELLQSEVYVLPHVAALFGHSHLELAPRDADDNGNGTTTRDLPVWCCATCHCRSGLPSRARLTRQNLHNDGHAHRGPRGRSDVEPSLSPVRPVDSLRCVDDRLLDEAIARYQVARGYRVVV